MKSQKISSRITASFVLVNTLYVIMIVLSLWSYSLSNTRLNNMHSNAVEPEIIIGEIRDAVLKERVALRQALLLEPDSAESAAMFRTLDAEHKKALSSIAEYRDHSSDPAHKAAASEFLSYYEKEYTPAVTELTNLIKDNNSQAAVMLLPAVQEREAGIDGKLDYFSGLVDERIAFFLDNAQFGFIRLLIISAVVIVLVMTLVVNIIRYMKRIISKRIEKLSKIAEKLSLGILDVDIEKDGSDEIGQLTDSLLSMTNNNKKQVDALVAIAKGDLTINVVPRCEDDTMGNALKQMVFNMNKMFSEINVVSAQVAASSRDIAQGAQSLAQGSTEQTATVNEINSSIVSMNKESNIDVDTADLSIISKLSIRDLAKDGSKKMEKLMDAIQQISDASLSIGRVIKVIDDIAFQTNILALNAAVEAARAGVHGKGFAVVAEEVRNLSGKSAEAARETSNLINENIQKTELGRSISQASVESLDRIVESIQNITVQLNESISQVSQVVQQISATSQQSAAASDELSGQAQMLRQLVAQFRIRDTDYQTERTNEFASNRQLAGRQQELDFMSSEPVLIST